MLSAASSGRSFHLIISQLRTKYIYIVRRAVRTMFSEQKVQLKNELLFVELSEVCSASEQFALPSGDTYCPRMSVDILGTS